VEKQLFEKRPIASTLCCIKCGPEGGVQCHFHKFIASRFSISSIEFNIGEQRRDRLAFAIDGSRSADPLGCHRSLRRAPGGRW
jgi:hypothetical protein